MKDRILGLHHMTAIAGDAQQNYDFYTKVLGLRLVKKTVNFDDPGTYHFYFADEVGTPGSVLTFFPYAGAHKGKAGPGMATEIGYSVAKGSLNFWKDRFDKFGVPYNEVAERFGEKYIGFQDPDGLHLELIVPGKEDLRTPFEVGEITAAVATKGFHSVTLSLKDKKATAAILTEIFGYELQEEEGNRYRYVTDAVETAAIIDLVELPNAEPGVQALGTNHHVAFRVKDEESLMAFRKRIVDRGFHITEKINRDYFYSLYFREPGGVLFEIATDNPGFATDETVEELGKNLQLPPQHEPLRAKIEKVLPILKK